MKGFPKGSRTRDARRPVSLQLCLSLGDKLGRFVGALLRWRFPLAFSWAFWISELVADSSSKVRGLLVSDVRVTGIQMSCVIRQSKMAQGGRGATVTLHSMVGSVMCLVRCFQS